MQGLKKLLILVIAIGIVLIIGIFWLTHMSPKKTVVGTSQINSLDVVSGDIHQSDQPSIVKYINSEMNSEIKGSDLVIRNATYKKVFDSNGKDYKLTFTTDIAPLRSSLDVTIYYNNSIFGPIRLMCSTQQKVNYTCNYKPAQYRSDE